MTPRRGEVWWVRLDPTVGSEIGKRRPCLVITTNVLNDRRRTIVVVPLSSSARAGSPLNVPVRCAKRDVVAVTDQVRAVSKDRFDRRLTALTVDDLEAVEQALREILELG